MGLAGTTKVCLDPGELPGAGEAPGVDGGKVDSGTSEVCGGWKMAVPAR